MLQKIRLYLIKSCAVQLALFMAVSAGWWGLLYPEMGLTKETAEVLTKTAEGQVEERPLLDAKERREAFFAMLEQPEKITVKSRFLEAILDIDIRGNEDEQQGTDRDF